MKKLFLIVVVLVIVTPLAYCLVPFPYYSWNQKLTVEVEKDGKIYQASSVVKLSFHRSVTPHGTAYYGAVKGEAVALELDKGQYLFALLTDTKNNQDYIKEVAAKHVFEKELLSLGAPSQDNNKNEIGYRNDWLPYMALLPLGKKGNLKSKFYPRFITFRDLNDRTSLKQIDPLKLEDYFGPNIRLKKVTIELTDEPVTLGRMQKILNWYPQRPIPALHENEETSTP